jgi:FkbM family methyltransferase
MSAPVCSGGPARFAVRGRGLAHEVLMRPRSTDVPMYHSIFTTPQYDVPLLQEPATIFDCGGNVGYAAVWFALRYPRARIFSVEPDKHNYSLLVRNTSPYTNIVPVHSALWNADTSLDVVDIGQGDCSFETREATHDSAHAVVGRTLAFSIATLMKLLNVEQVDFMKVDIEGAEQQLFAGDLGWLKSVGVIAIEFHDERCLGLRERFDGIAPQFFSHKAQFGENVFYARAPFIGPNSPKERWSKL